MTNREMGSKGDTRPGKRLQFANLKMAIESSLIYPLKMVIFHSYVSLPEGIWLYLTFEIWVKLLALV